MPIVILNLLALMLFLFSCADGESPVLSSLSSDHYTYDCTEITNNTSSPMGVNLIFLSHFSDSQWLFVDAFTKASFEWYASSDTLGWDQGEITSYDSNGWPTGVNGDTQPAVILNQQIKDMYPTGTYVLHWEGSGGVPNVDSDGTNLRCEDGEAITNCPSQRALFDVNSTSNSGIVISIIPDDPLTYNAGNYINNIRVIMPGGMCGTSTTNLENYSYCESSRGGQGTCSSGQTCYDFDDIHWDRFNDPFSEIDNPKILFHPFSMQKLRKFRAIRYQELLHMQGTSVTDWNSRTQKEDFTWTGTDGVPPEITIHMSNYLDADPWVNIPHEATDGYATSFANYANTNLDSDLDVYLEYSNEPWNPDTTNFPQSQYFLDEAVANSIGVGEVDYIRKVLAYVDRAVEIFDLWTTEYGVDAGKITRLISSWGGFNDVAPAMLDYPGVSGKVDAIAVGPYIGIYMSFAEHESVVENWGVESVFREFEEGLLGADDALNGAMRQTLDMIDDNAEIASNYGVDLLGYESGGHLWAEATETNMRIRRLFRETVLDSRMGQYYLQLYNHWRAAGGKLINNFAHMFPHRLDQFGTYTNEYAQCEDLPKAGSVNQFIIDNPCWWSGCDD